MKVPTELPLTVRLCRMKLKMLVLLVLMGPAIANSSALEKKKGDEVIAKPNLTPLMIAALSCDLNKVTSLLSDGADVKAIDARGNDALTYASTQRTKDMFLQCPDVV